ncbi:sensor histidine kinase [Streptosporangium sp. NPDC003464]
MTARAPYPGLGQIDELTAKASEAGLDLKLEEISPAAPVPSAVDSAAYRILQESITNVIRHVGPTRVTVALKAGNEVLEIRVTDEGRPAAPGDDRADPPARQLAGTRAPAEPGRGILGMRERCLLLGGQLDAGSLPGGGFEVRARLPLVSNGPRI